MSQLPPKALKKILLHSAKYSSQDVIGVITQNDAFPLFHSRVTTVATEVALTLLKNEKICGFYESRIRPSGQVLEPSRLISALANALKARTSSPVVVLCVDCDLEKASPAVLFELSGSNLVKRAELSREDLRDAFEEVNKNTIIFDFDDHFADANVDWRNLQVV